MTGITETPWPIETRRQASEAGRRKYYTGRPCKYKHVSQRYTNSGQCIACMLNRGKQYSSNIKAADAGLVTLTFHVHPNDVATVKAIVKDITASREEVTPCE